ncbi:hypothetical protein ABZW03_36215, partial [Kitasatospora sp. NPDC004799]
MRAVLVEYADGVVDAVLVARRSVPYGVLVRLAALLLDGEPLGDHPLPALAAPGARGPPDREGAGRPAAAGPPTTASLPGPGQPP